MKLQTTPLAALRFAGLLLGCVLLFACCERSKERAAAPPPAKPLKANNLKYVDCNKHLTGSPATVEIAVHAAGGVAPVDEMVFVCTGEIVHWKSAGDADPEGNKVKSFTVSFPGNGWPFKLSQRPLRADGDASTPDQDVAALPAGSRPKPFKYSIVVTKTNGATYTVDPVLIPMGE